ESLLGQLRQAELHFTLDNEHTLIPTLVAHLQQYLLCMGLCDPNGKVRVGIALEEALVNAMYHGNLAVSSELRYPDDAAYYRLAAERRRQPPYRDRQVSCTARFTPSEAVYIIRDEGSGFDPAALPDPTDPANLERASGRGLLLIRTFMDSVTFNERGNEITL